MSYSATRLLKKVFFLIQSHLEKVFFLAAAVYRYGVQLAVEMGRELLAGGAPGLHIYTLNLETAAMGIAKRLNLVDETVANRSCAFERREEASIYTRVSLYSRVSIKVLGIYARFYMYARSRKHPACWRASRSLDLPNLPAFGCQPPN